MWDEKTIESFIEKNKNEKILLVICGPTASGKTEKAIEIANFFNTEIISADSRQIYKEIPICTAQPTLKELNLAKHHLIGTISVFDNYDVYKFQEEALKILEKIFLKNQIAILCGGTGMYIDAICNGIDNMPSVSFEIRIKLNNYFRENGLAKLLEKLEKVDPEYFAVVDKNNPRRVIRALEVFYASGKKFSFFRTGKVANRNFKILKLKTEVEKNILHQKIEKRADLMIKNGLIDEISKLIPLKNNSPLNIIGAKEIIYFLEGKYSLKDAIDSIKINTKRYAKRQITWFKKY